MTFSSWVLSKAFSLNIGSARFLFFFTVLLAKLVLSHIGPADYNLNKQKVSEKLPTQSPPATRWHKIWPTQNHRCPRNSAGHHGFKQFEWYSIISQQMRAVKFSQFSMTFFGLLLDFSSLMWNFSKKSIACEMTGNHLNQTWRLIL